MFVFCIHSSDSYVENSSCCGTNVESQDRICQYSRRLVARRNAVCWIICLLRYDAWTFNTVCRMLTGSKYMEWIAFAFSVGYESKEVKSDLRLFDTHKCLLWLTAVEKYVLGSRNMACSAAAQALLAHCSIKWFMGFAAFNSCRHHSGNAFVRIINYVRRSLHWDTGSQVILCVVYTRQHSMVRDGARIKTVLKQEKPIYYMNWPMA